jgi:hypothetical protein
MGSCFTIDVLESEPKHVKIYNFSNEELREKGWELCEPPTRMSNDMYIYAKYKLGGFMIAGKDIRESFVYFTQKF